MCSKLPLMDPAQITCPVLVMRGQYDGIAAFDDVLAFFQRLPNPDKQFAVMPGMAHNSLKQSNYRIAYHLLYSFLTQPEPVYRG
jgi:pimeloyl-ACP methyl ester carboxylesterase